MNIPVLVLSLLGVATSAIATPLSGLTETHFFKTSMVSCTSNMKKNTAWNKSEIENYCSCTCLEALKTVTVEDIIGNKTAEISQKGKVAGDLCLKRMYDKQQGR